MQYFFCENHLEANCMGSYKLLIFFTPVCPYINTMIKSRNKKEEMKIFKKKRKNVLTMS